MLIPCPHCSTRNNVPDERLGDGPTCGQCKQSLLPAGPVELNATNFDAVAGRHPLTVVVDFWADWCGPCKMMAPHFAQAAGQRTGKVLFAKLDTEAAPAIAGRYQIRSIPCLVAFRDGQEIGRLTGARPAGDILRWVDGLG